MADDHQPPPRVPLRWQLEIDRETRPIEGRVQDGQGRVRTFSSWVALLAVLEALRTDAGRRGGEP